MSRETSSDTIRTDILGRLKDRQQVTHVVVDFVWRGGHVRHLVSRSRRGAQMILQKSSAEGRVEDAG